MLKLAEFSEAVVESILDFVSGSAWLKCRQYQLCYSSAASETALEETARELLVSVLETRS